MPAWIHDADPVTMLQVNKVVDKFKVSIFCLVNSEHLNENGILCITVMILIFVSLP